MSIGRRINSDSRRRRVLIYQSSRDSDHGAGPDRRLVEKLRQARRPATTYGASVNRRLRGRWYSLVPVRRRAMAGASLVILGTAALLCLAHWLAITWQPLAYREAIARPLRLDRPDSFGTWARAVLLAVAAGSSLLVYQLRRYRNDDYRGSYRIWPPVIILIAVASLDCVCGLVPWCGELIDLMLGKRVAMAGSDWIRIGMTVGGAALALRLVAEVRHSKLSLVMMLLAILCFATPLAARWGILRSDTPLMWWLITSAPLMAAATLSVACGAYLRKLFREVRRLDEEDQLSLRLRQWQARLFPAKAVEGSDDPPPRAAEKPKPTKPASTGPSNPATVKPATVEDSAAQPRPSHSPPDRKGRFAWLFGRARRAAARPGSSAPGPTEKKTQAAMKTAPAAAAAATGGAKPDIEPTIRSPQAAKAPETAAKAPETAAKAPETAAKRRRPLTSVLGGWLRRSKSPAVAKPVSKATTTGAAAAASRSTSVTSSSGEDDDDDVGDDSSVDWASLSKAERRRLRRELKRSGEAA